MLFDKAGEDGGSIVNERPALPLGEVGLTGIDEKLFPKAELAIHLVKRRCVRQVLLQPLCQAALTKAVAEGRLVQIVCRW